MYIRGRDMRVRMRGRLKCCALQTGNAGRAHLRTLTHQELRCQEPHGLALFFTSTSLCQQSNFCKSEISI